MRILDFLKQAPQADERITLALGEQQFDIAVMRNPRARRYTLRVRDAKRDVVLTMPARGSIREAHRFAEKHTAWIASKLAQLPGRVPFADGETLPVRGIAYRIVHRPHARGTAWLEHSEENGAMLCVAGKSEHVSRRVRDFLKREAKVALTAATRKYAGMLGVTVSRIGLRDSTSRWGSCSESGAISYSWRLILAPDYVLDYLAAHEVAHRRELNHSERFWNLLYRMCPEAKRAEAWLTREGKSLHRYG
ncbi:MAG: M48 family metallopeptidase [Xanthobacteraceae bacterium]|nr:M48 family metallopeptidase [Xanthobacteraceae bacterium]QYK45134.1 MAG: M48 family metallopeptidase [Xanthobacteraceae bacterium]